MCNCECGSCCNGGTPSQTHGRIDDVIAKPGARRPVPPALEQHASTWKLAHVVGQIQPTLPFTATSAVSSLSTEPAINCA